MEGESSSGKAASSLLELPSQGYFASVLPSTTLGGLRVYVCDHDTTPPADQLIKTDPTNILIRSLTLKAEKGKEKEEEKVKGKEAEKPKERKRKRSTGGESPEASSKSPKKAKKEKLKKQKAAAATTSASGTKNYEAYTCKELRGLLRAKGLSVKGNKNDLVERLKQRRRGH